MQILGTPYSTFSDAGGNYALHGSTFGAGGQLPHPIVRVNGRGLQPEDLISLHRRPAATTTSRCAALKLAPVRISFFFRHRFGQMGQILAETCLVVVCAPRVTRLEPNVGGKRLLLLLQFAVHNNTETLPVAPWGQESAETSVQSASSA